MSISLRKGLAEWCVKEHWHARSDLRTFKARFHLDYHSVVEDLGE